MRFTSIVAIIFLSLFVLASAASARIGLPPVPDDDAIIQVRGAHGHGWHGNRGHHYGWYLGRGNWKHRH